MLNTTAAAALLILLLFLGKFELVCYVDAVVLVSVFGICQERIPKVDLAQFVSTVEIYRKDLQAYLCSHICTATPHSHKLR